MDWFQYDNGLCHETVNTSSEIWQRFEGLAEITAGEREKNYCYWQIYKRNHQGFTSHPCWLRGTLENWSKKTVEWWILRFLRKWGKLIWMNRRYCFYLERQIGWGRTGVKQWLKLYSPVNKKAWICIIPIWSRSSA